MICPKCHERVDPISASFWWFDALDGKEQDKDSILEAIYIWDQSAMYISGHSILPTELRDAIRWAIRERTEPIDNKVLWKQLNESNQTQG